MQSSQNLKARRVSVSTSCRRTLTILSRATVLFSPGIEVLCMDPNSEALCRIMSHVKLRTEVRVHLRESMLLWISVCNSTDGLHWSEDSTALFQPSPHRCLSEGGSDVTLFAVTIIHISWLEPWCKLELSTNPAIQDPRIYNDTLYQ